MVTYFSTDDVTATLQKASAAGGTTLMESTPIPTVGDIGIFLDPTGNLLGVWKPAGQ
ncbi:MAG: hypothetical protein HY328_05305 [Chloroflexi bacterium]|nr:hypothetical protein [Chloroflexota bacterium]